jgi:hypothetical protein
MLEFRRRCRHFKGRQAFQRIHQACQRFHQARQRRHSVCLLVLSRILVLQRHSVLQDIGLQRHPVLQDIGIMVVVIFLSHRQLASICRPVMVPVLFPVMVPVL